MFIIKFVLYFYGNLIIKMSKNYNLFIGSHVSLSAPKYFLGSVEEAISYNANALMVYTGAPQNTIRKPMDLNNIDQAHKLMEKNNIKIENLVVHAPYIINLCSEKAETRQLAVEFLSKEIDRCMQLKSKLLVLHPGSRLSQSVETGLQQVIDGINFVLKDKKTDVIICLETMAGKGSEVGKTLDELKIMIDGIKYPNNIGVCIDTCHLNDGGYDMNKFDEFLNEFDQKIGLHKIKVVHLNDSKNPINSNKDRHENLGYGHIEFKALNHIAWHEKLDNIPKILETPYVVIDKDKKSSLPPYKYEIEIIRSKKWSDYKKELIK